MLLLLTDSDYNIRSELFSQNEQGIYLDPTLSEAARTWRRNLLLWTEDFSNSAWFKNGCTATAGKITENSATSSHLVGLGGSIPTLPAQTVVTFSVEVKAAERSWAIVGITSTGTGAAYVDLTTGQFGNNFSSAPDNKTITDAGDGWWRVSITRVLPATATVDTRIYISTGNGVSSYLGDGASGILIRNAQLELGSTPTTYQRITDFSTEFKAAFPTHHLYTDLNGVTPAVAPGDSVGLILDQRQGALSNLGPELVTNGGFDTDLAGWSTINTVTAIWSSGVFNITADSVATGGLFQDITTTAAFVRITFRARRVSGTSIARFWGVPRTGGFASPNTQIALIESTTWQDYSFIIQRESAATGIRVYLQAVAGTGVWEFDNISVREVPGNHAFQPTTGAPRPALARVPFGGRRNLLQKSEEFDNAAWTKDNSATVTANTSIAPDGTTTADTLTAGTTGTFRQVRQSFALSSGNQRTFSCYLKSGTASVAYLLASDMIAHADGRYFDLSNGTLGGQTGMTVGSTVALNDSSIESVGDGWYRCRITVTVTASTTFSFLVGIADANNSTTSTAGKTIISWGAQLETGSSATNYQKSSGAGAVIDVTEAGQPDCWALFFDGSDDFLQTNAIDFAAATVGPRRNLIRSSENFQSPWTNWISAATYGEAGPEGVNNAATFTNVVGSGGANLAIIVPDYTPNQPHVLTFWAKAGTSSNAAVGMFATATGTFINTTATILSGPGSLFGTSLITISGLTSSWTKIQMVFTAPTTNNLNLFYYIETSGSRTGLSNTLAQFQIELGSTPTAYQPTGTDEMTVITGVRKLSDAATGIIAELSTTISVNNGAFWLVGPTTAAADYGFRSKGTSLADCDLANVYAAPRTDVLAGVADISADSCILRLNGTQLSTVASDQGSGNYGNHILYIGRRAGSSLPFNGLLHHFIARGASTSGSKLTGAEKLTGKKSGLNI